MTSRTKGRVKMSDFIRAIENALDNLGHNCDDHSRSRPYGGQPHTVNGIRGATEIKGVTFRDLRDAYIRAVFQSAHHLAPHLYEQAQKGEQAMISENDLYSLDWNDLDPMAIMQNLSCEIEGLMGIFPNIPKLQAQENDE